MGPHKYIEKMIDGYQNISGDKLRTQYSSPLEKSEHPEVDSLELLLETRIQDYQSLIGSLQWALYIGRFYIATAIMDLSRFQ